MPIVSTPGVCGGSACIMPRLPVWILAGLRRQGETDAGILEQYPDLTAAELAEAWAYAEANQAEIEADTERNAVGTK